MADHWSIKQALHSINYHCRTILSPDGASSEPRASRLRRPLCLRPDHPTPWIASHPTAAYVGKVREVRELGSGSKLLRAVAGMIPPGKKSLMPERNAIQSLVASIDEDGDWKIDLFQNTPARFNGRPDEAQKLTQELEAELERAG